MACSAQEFLETFGKSIEGWLFDGAVYVTNCLIDAQRSMGVNTGCLEIGVYKGKYLSYLAAASGVPCVGMDVFIFDQQRDAERNIGDVARWANIENRVKLIQVNTRTHTPESFRNALYSADVKQLSFASIDGDHSADGVAHDLTLVESALIPGGIIAVDDMYSGMSPEVSEGFFRYMHSGSHLRPIAFSDNKLFMTTPGFDELYRIKLMVEMSKGDTLIGQRWLDGSQCNRIRPMLGGTVLNL
ncbi:class I SAM-dependent methyltransferase [Burkholderia multivorans]|nr:class I SAM-dependent methyltransferase [Burkholderia multivorans]